MANNKNPNTWYVALTTIILMAILTFNVVRVFNDDYLELSSGQWDSTDHPHDHEEAMSLLDQADLASLAKSNAKRTTELGEAVTGKRQAPGKEIDVIFAADPAMSQKWDLTSTQTQEAWSKHRAYGSRDIRVCVIDTGIDVKHMDLKDNLWINPGESGSDSKGKDKAKNNVDDDNNGCIDDIHGCNFVNNNNDLTDHHGHGTHIAGIIGAVGGNGIGISGVSPRVSLMIAKYYDPNSAVNNNLINTVRAIRYCIINKAHIINYSGGGTEPSDKERQAIAEAREKGIIFVAAAGNEQSDSDKKKYYPADYDLDNIISTTAFDREKNILPTSNYGVTTVDIAAPGKNIYSTVPGGNYAPMTGTSQATALVTGVAAILKSRFSDFDAARIIRHITETGDLDSERLHGKTRNEKRLNAYRALAILDSGVSVSGAITKNTNYLPATQFSVSVQDLTTESGSRSISSPEVSLGNLGRELRELLNQKNTKNQP